MEQLIHRRNSMIEESKIRERAYELWEKDDCPEGADQFYWRLGQDQLEAETQILTLPPQFHLKRTSSGAT
jgi:hypothetical protein